MIDWLKILNESSIEWLLEKSNPSVRYFTLRDILDRSTDSEELSAAKNAISESVVVQRILRKQNVEGYWGDPDSPYLPKYKSSYWTVMLLARLGMDRTNPKVEKACEFLFRYQHMEGGFSSETSVTASKEYQNRRKKGKKLPPEKEFELSYIYENQLSCLTGNMVAALCRIGYAEDIRVKKALEWLVRIQNDDGGWLCPYWKAHVKDKHGCFMGTICPMEAFSELPEQLLTEEIKKAIFDGAEFLLMHRLFKADHHDLGIINQSWLELSFPWFGYNILRGLDILTKLGYSKDNRMNDAIETLLQKRNGNGIWILENSPMGRMQSNIETKGQPSKWLTMIALRMIKRLSRNV